MTKTVLITGVAGFIGSLVACFFSEQGWKVIGIDKSSPERTPLSSLSAYYSLKLPDPALKGLLQKHSPQVCIHCAGSASVSLSIIDPVNDFYINTALTFEILNALRLDAPSCRFIFLSSAAVYGNPESLPVSENQHLAPISPYGFHKLECEQLCLEFTKVYGLPTASVRIFSAYGPGLRRQVIWDICKKVITQKSLTLQGTGKESRDFIHALDIARALNVVATSAPMHGEVYNLGSGRETTIAELANIILDALGTNFTPQFDGVVPPGTPLNWRGDISRLNALGFIPAIPLNQGIKTFANWCRNEITGV